MIRPSPDTRASDLARRIYFDYLGNMEKYDVLDALAALAQESRLDVFRLLVRAGGAGLPAGEIAAELGLPSATLSFHLSQLRHAGLVRCRRRGRSLIYAAEYSAMNDLIGYLTENCCEGGGTCDVDVRAPAEVVTRRATQHETAARSRRR